MKILALGGCGEMGLKAVRTLITYDFVEQIVIADIDLDKAQSAAREFEPRATPLKVDVSDNDALRKAMRDIDVVVNTVGPYYRFGVKVLSASIACGCHYFDINDDWEPTLEMLALDEEAKSAGVTAIIGMGASPGMSNMLAVEAMSKLDTAEEIFTGWDLDSAKPKKIESRPTAATIHGIHQLTGFIRVYRNGILTDARPIQKIMLDYPGIGTKPVWTIGHPEAVTLPRYYPTLRSSTNVMTASCVNILGIRFIAWLVNIGLISAYTAARLAERIEGPEDPERTPDILLREFKDRRKPKLPPLFALAKGIKKDKPASVGSMILSAPKDGMAGATGVPLAVGVSLLEKNKISKKGIFSTEAAIDPNDFFKELAPHCSPRKNDIHDLVLTTCSWESN